MVRETRTFRISSPGRLPVDATLGVAGEAWSLSLVEWGGPGALTVEGTDAAMLRLLRIVSGYPDPSDLRDMPAIGAADAPSGKPVVYHLGSGGFVHQLNLLGNSLAYCQAFGATLVPILDCTQEWGLPFGEFFRPLAPEFATPEEQADLLARMGERLGLPIGGIQDITFSWTPDAPVNYELTGPLAGARGLGLDWSGGPAPGEAILTAGTPWPPEGMARGWPAAIGQITLQDWAKEELARRTAPLPARYVGAHFRNTDISSDLRQVAEAIRLAAGERGIGDLFWATDDVDSRGEIAALLPDLRVHALAATPSVRAIPGGALHFLRPEQLREAGLSKSDLILASLADMLALIRAEVFIPSGNSTGWTGFVQGLRATPDIAVQFFGPQSP